MCAACAVTAVDKMSIAAKLANTVRFIEIPPLGSLFSVSLLYHHIKRPSKNFAGESEKEVSLKM